MQRQLWNEDWRFSIETTPEQWQTIHLPHSAKTEAIHRSAMWQGRCTYRKQLNIDPTWEDKVVGLHFEAAMLKATVTCNGQVIAEHEGGYTPFKAILPQSITHGTARSVEIAVILDNRYDPNIPPAKPLDELDFKWYHGIYRNVYLEVEPSLHISDAFTEDSHLRSGLKLSTHLNDNNQAVLDYSLEIVNRGNQPEKLSLELQLLGVEASIQPLVAKDRHQLELAPQSALVIEGSMVVDNPKLWGIDTPHLHDLVIRSQQGDRSRVLGKRRIGLKDVRFSRSSGFVLNKKSLRLRGTNRHQEFPWIGNALSDASQLRDAKRIKAAGFDYVRCSHYPQSPAFLDACDELGIVVMNCLPGWQHMGGEAFQSACYQNARDMIRRDHHHPSVVLWELSLNETEMPDAFMEQMELVAKEEFLDQNYHTCGWLDRYDVYIRSRQHGQLRSWKNGDKALVIAEYGDWEYYARNDGFDQGQFGNLMDPACNSRQSRLGGESAMLQQAHNHEEALSDNYNTPACLDGQ